jgi:hypothetical protein
VANILFTSDPPPNPPFNSLIDPILLQEYLSNGWVLPSPPGFNKNHARLFTVKQNNKVRLIFDCRFINRYVMKNRFLLEDLRTVQRISHNGDFFAKIDLQKAYHQVVMDESARRYLGFRANGLDYHFRVMPFGLSCAPMILTKALKAVAALARSKGVRLNIYLDDILIASPSPVKLIQDVQTVVDCLHTYGWRINFEKCQFDPSNSIDYIGAHISSTPMVSMTITSEAFSNLQSQIRLLLSGSSIPLFQVRRFLGILNWSLRFAPLLKTHRTPLQLQLLDCLHRNQNRLVLNAPSKARLAALLKHPLESFRLYSIPSPELIVSSDATLDVLAASIRDAGKILDTTSSLHPCEEHINVKEARAVLLAVNTFKDLLRGKSVLFAIDNQVVLYNLRSGLAANPEIQELVMKIYDGLLDSGVKRAWFSYVRSKENTLADSLSRPDHESWSLNKGVLSEIAHTTNFFPQLELFGDETNHLLPSFVSKHPNRRALFHNAFSRDWSALPPMYANPPFSLLGRVLQKIVAERPSILLIAPEWPSRPWWPLLLEADQIYRLPRSSRLFSFLGRFHYPLKWSPLVAVFLARHSRSSIQVDQEDFLSQTDFHSFKNPMMEHSRNDRSTIVL